MKSLVFIDACMRGKESRTRRIAEPIIDKLSERYEIIKYDLNQLPLTIVQEDLIQKRAHGDYDSMSLSWAETIRDADRIVIAAPFWDKVSIILLSVIVTVYLLDILTGYIRKKLK